MRKHTQVVLRPIQAHWILRYVGCYLFIVSSVYNFEDLKLCSLRDAV